MVDSTGLRRKLAKVIPSIKTEVEGQLDRDTDKVVRSMKIAAPFKEGDLELSIKAEIPSPLPPTRGGGKWFALRRITAGSDKAFYARWQEFGTSRMPANPFFYPTWRAERKRVRANLTRAVRRGVKKASKG